MIRDHRGLGWTLGLALLIAACGGAVEPSGAADVADIQDTTPIDIAEDTAEVLPLPDTAPPPPDVADPPDEGPVDPCLSVTCEAPATCVITEDGGTTCLVQATVTETFDTTDQKADGTTALWGDGTLTVGGGGIGGDGSDGSFAPTEDVVVDTTGKPLFQYTTMTIPTGVTVTVVGENPWDVKVQGDVTIDGWIRSDGGPGLHICKKPDGSGGQVGGTVTAGGVGGAGARAGGAGGAGYAESGQPGGGPGGGEASVILPGGSTTYGAAAGAGGGGYGNAGGDGVAMSNGTVGLGGVEYGTPDIPFLLGGSGGGGGAGRDYGGNDKTCGTACNDNQMNCYQGNCQGDKPYNGDQVVNEWDRPGGSGGGGGGGIVIETNAGISIRGGISADGGNGGWGDSSGSGGGGSGGTIRLRAWTEVTLIGGVLSARGGKGGVLSCGNIDGKKKAGDGGDGRILIASMSGLTQGYLVNPNPAPSFGQPSAVLMGGSGALGAFEPTEDVVLNTDEGPFEYTSFELPAGVTLTATGSAPLVIHASAYISIYGDIALNGQKGETGYSACCGSPYPAAHAGQGGAGAAGGHPGGAGGEAGPGESGGGVGGSPGGPIGVYSSAGGAGFAAPGQTGGTNKCNELGPAGGPVYGDEGLTELVGGSGGGGAGDGRADGVGCGAPEKWTPGSGGGGGGGALQLETPGLVRIDGTVRLNGGDGGDSQGASKYKDGTCEEDCKGACVDGVCYSSNDGTCNSDCSSSSGCINGICYKNGGSFGGSGGGGSGGGLLIRGAGLRADGTLQARGGGSGKLNQTGGCKVDPDNETPLPGQSRGGLGSAGRIRIETQSSTGSILIDEGSFQRLAVEPVYGTYAESHWYALADADATVTGVTMDGGSALDVLNLQVAPAGADGQVNENQASPWSVGVEGLPTGAFVRFRLHLPEPGSSGTSSVIETLSIAYQYPAP